MENKNYSQFSDQELLDEAKKLKSFSFVNALFIGILLGIVFFSIRNNTFGLVMLIPLYFIYKMVNDPRNKRFKEIEKILKERNLKF